MRNAFPDATDLLAIYDNRKDVNEGKFYFLAKISNT